MASIAKRPDGRWRARYRGPDGQERSKHFTRKVDAHTWLDGQASATLTGTWTDPARGRTTVGEWAASWLDGQVGLKASTRSRYGGLLRVQVLPALGTTPLARVEHSTVAAWVAGLSASGLAAATVRQAHRVLSLVLDSAVRDGRLPRNPAAGVPLPRAARPPHRYLTRPQVEALAAAAGDDGDLVRLLALTGLRFGEVVALRVGRVDLLRRRLDVAEAVAEVEGTLVWGAPKTHARRSVPLARSLVDDLTARCAGKAPGDLVFTAPGGGPLRGNNWRSRVFLPAVRAAGLEPLHPHALRHTAASLAISAGASVPVVARLLGHASPAVTLTVYAHLFDADLDAVADRLDQDHADYLRTTAVVLPMPSRLTGT